MAFSIQKCKENNPECLVLVADDFVPGDHPACKECDAQCTREQENEELGKVLIEKLTKEELTGLCQAFEDGSLEDIFYDQLYPQDLLNYPEKYVDPSSDAGREYGCIRVE